MWLLPFLIFVLPLYPGWTLSEGKNSSCIANANVNLGDFNFSDCSEVILNATVFNLNGILLIANAVQIQILGDNTSVKCSPNSGITVKHVVSIEFYLVQFHHCSLLRKFRYDKMFQIGFYSAIYVFNVTKITFYNVTVKKSNGTGLVILNSKQVEIINSEFTSNVWKAMTSNNIALAGGGGVHIEISCAADVRSLHSPGQCFCQNVNITIVNSWFQFNRGDNISLPNSKDFGQTVFTSFGKGGGLAIHIRDQTADNTVQVSNCHFHSNWANFGGGANIILSNDVSNTNISMYGNTLKNNSVKYSGGGLDIGFVGENLNSNTIKISYTNFINNCAISGGSVSLFFLYSSITELSCIAFSNSQWENNTAHYGAALFVYTLQTVKTSLDPKIQLKNNIIVNNTVASNETEGVKSLGEGIIMTTKQNLELTGYILFQSNNGSCIYATSSNIYFKQVQATFLRNSALYGAGLYLIGFSSVILTENTTVTFCNNSVSGTGSAIYYYSIDKTSYIYSRFCFIQVPDYIENIKIYFFGNSAPKTAVYAKKNLQYDLHVIHAAANTYSSCFDGNFQKLYKSNQVKFSKHCQLCQPASLHSSSTHYVPHDINFCDTDDMRDIDGALFCKTGLSSQENRLTKTRDIIEFIPGIEFEIPLQINSNSCNSSDSHGNGNWSSFDISIENNPNSLIKSSKSVARTNSLAKFSLEAIPGNTGQLILTETGFRKLQVRFNVRALPCPPLFKIKGEEKCKCFFPEEIPYPEFHKCNSTQAELRLGFWIGYEIVDNLSIILVSHCPPGFCSTKVNENNYLPLPKTLDPNLSNVVCDNRFGTLCGSCSNDTTVYFHTEYFKCDKADLCHLGPLLYILSEIIPLTTFFLVVIFFDIRFTSGYLNGFIFFAQMYNTITHTGSSFLKKSSNYHKLSIIHRIIYKFFDFDFFSIDTLSFCLFKTNNTLNIVSFKYVTVIYALLLVFGTAWFLNKCSAKLNCRQLVKLKYSILQGFSAFLVMVYSQCTQVSFMILNVVKIYKPENKSYYYNYVPFFRGNIAYFGKEHLPYAIPALICISTIVLALPMLLLYYPLCNKIISFFKLNENRFIIFASKLVPLSKFKPLFDSMQGSFKDHLRFYAGLYFVYRVAIIATVIQARVEWIHTLIEIEITAMLGIHTVLWPYRENIHNIIDALVFCNLLLIVILKRFSFSMAEKGSQFSKDIKIIHWFQILLINLPLLVLLLKLLHYLMARFKLRQFLCCQKRKKLEEKVEINNALLDDSLLDHCTRVGSFSESYMQMKERQIEKLMNSN